MTEPQQTAEAQFTITGMFPADDGLYALYVDREGKNWRTPILAWGTWLLRHTARDRFDAPKTETFQQSGPIVYAFEVGMLPAPFVPNLPSLRGKDCEYRGVQWEAGAIYPLWAPRTTADEPAAQDAPSEPAAQQTNPSD